MFLHNLTQKSDSPGSGSPNASVASQELNVEDTIELLGDDEEKETVELPKQKLDVGEVKDDESETEKDELEELEDEIKEPTDEQLELIAPVRRREILKKYPNLFKDFPYLEKAYYREQQFTELLPTIDDAKTAVEKAQTLDRFEQDIIRGGNTETILQAVKEENPEAFYKIVDNYLPTLAKVDERAYYHVLSNVSKHTIVAMVQEATRSKNEPLRLAAHILNQFVFGSSEFSPPTNLAKNQNGQNQQSERSEPNQREQEFFKKQFDNTLGDLNTRVNNTLRNTIEANIDPRQSMTDYVRKNASRDALDQLNQLIGQDSRFRVLTDKLWEKAVEDNFSKESIDRIKSAYLAKSKSLLPTVIKKARNEALRGMGKRVADDSDADSTSLNKRGPVTPGRPLSQSSGKSGKITKATDIPKGMSTLDFLNSD